MTFSALIAAWMYKYDLTATGASMKLSMTRQSVHNWLQGKTLPTKRQIPSIAKALRVTPTVVAEAIAKSLVAP